MNFKRFKWSIIALLVVMLIAVGCGNNNSGANSSTGSNGSSNTASEAPKPKPDKQTVLRLSTNHAADYPTTLALDEFAKTVEAETEGRIKIEVYPSAQLGEEQDVVEQLQIGAIDFARISLATITEFSRSLDVLILPYLYRDSNHMWNVLEGEIGDEFLQSVSNANLIGLTFYDAGSRNFYNTKHDVKSVADLKGMKIRVQESKLMMGLVEALNASATPMPFSDVYNSLQTGVIDGAENNWPSFISTNHYEVAKYFTVDEHSRVPEMLIASKMVMDGLSAEDQEIIHKAARDSLGVQKELWAAEEAKSEQIAKDAGVSVTYLDSNEEFQKAVEHLYAEFGGEYTELIDRIKAVQ